MKLHPKRVISTRRTTPSDHAAETKVMYTSALSPLMRPVSHLFRDAYIRTTTIINHLNNELGKRQRQDVPSSHGRRPARPSSTLFSTPAMPDLFHFRCLQCSILLKYPPPCDHAKHWQQAYWYFSILSSPILTIGPIKSLERSPGSIEVHP